MKKPARIQTSSATRKGHRKPTVEICILAGGLSSRMGRDKASLRLSRKTLVNHIRAEVRPLELPVRVMRRDVVSRCGPIGGIYTALRRTKADAVLFLACDMPFITRGLLQKILKQMAGDRAVFTKDGAAGFPLLIPINALAKVEGQIKAREFSLQALARVSKARFVKPTGRQSEGLFNINTPDDWAKARAFMIARG